MKSMNIMRLLGLQRVRVTIGGAVTSYNCDCLTVVREDGGQWVISCIGLYDASNPVDITDRFAVEGVVRLAQLIDVDQFVCMEGAQTGVEMFGSDDLGRRVLIEAVPRFPSGLITDHAFAMIHHTDPIIAGAARECCSLVTGIDSLAHDLVAAADSQPPTKDDLAMYENAVQRWRRSERLLLESTADSWSRLGTQKGYNDNGGHPRK